MADGTPVGEAIQLFCAYSTAVQLVDYGWTGFNMVVLI